MATKSSLKFNRPKFNQVVTALYEAYCEKKYLYMKEHKDNISAPQVVYRPEQIEVGSKEHLVYLFFATTLTYRSGSDVWFSQVKKLYNLYPEMFSEAVARMDTVEIQSALKEVGFTFPAQGAGYWKQSGKTLYTHFDGNPLGLFRFADVDHFLAYKKRLSGQDGGKGALSGIAPKIYSLMAIFFEEVGALKQLPKGTFPVDLHVMRILMGRGAIEATGLVDAAHAVAEPTRRLLYEICSRKGYPIQDVAHAFWFLGSRACYSCSRIQGIDLICPIYQKCGGSPTTETYGRLGKWDFDSGRMPKGHRQGMLGSTEMALDRLLLGEFVPSSAGDKEKLRRLVAVVGASEGCREPDPEQIILI